MKISALNNYQLERSKNNSQNNNEPSFGNINFKWGIYEDTLAKLRKQTPSKLDYNIKLRKALAEGIRMLRRLKEEIRIHNQSGKFDGYETMIDDIIVRDKTGRNLLNEITPPLKSRKTNSFIISKPPATSSSGDITIAQIQLTTNNGQKATIGSKELKVGRILDYLETNNNVLVETVA